MKTIQSAIMVNSIIHSSVFSEDTHTRVRSAVDGYKYNRPGANDKWALLHLLGEKNFALTETEKDCAMSILAGLS